MVLFITSYMPASVVRASEIDNVDSCAMDYLENKEIINNDVKIKTFYPGGSVSAALTVMVIYIVGEKMIVVKWEMALLFTSIHQ